MLGPHYLRTKTSRTRTASDILCTGESTTVSSGNDLTDQPDVWNPQGRTVSQKPNEGFSWQSEKIYGILKHLNFVVHYWIYIVYTNYIVLILKKNVKLSLIVQKQLQGIELSSSDTTVLIVVVLKPTTTII